MLTQKSFSKWMVLFLILFLIGGCQKFNFTDEGFEEAAQSVSEALADLDDALSANTERGIVRGTLPSYGLICLIGAPLTECSEGVRQRNFNGCTRGGATWDGMVTLSFSDSNCFLDSEGDTITRTTSDVFVTGRRGASISVNTDLTSAYDGTELGGGQKVTKTDDGYSFEVLGITRIGALANGSELFNISRKTTEVLNVTGENRRNRTVDGGTLVSYHNIMEFTVSWVPSSVTWESDCKCPISGTLTGTLSGSKTGTITMEYTGCGTATLTRDGSTSDVTLDSCERASVN